MPATDQTCYNMKKLHKVFAVSSVLLLLATIWMFAVDHHRMWKRIQRTSDRIDLRMTEWRKLQVLTEDVMSERERLEQAFRTAVEGAAGRMYRLSRGGSHDADVAGSRAVVHRVGRRVAHERVFRGGQEARRAWQAAA